MRKHTLILFFFFLFIAVNSIAQTDSYSGTWRMQHLRGGGLPPINVELQIAASERNILYPARLKIECDSFTGNYELLLVKKDSRELAISTNKYKVSETPFSLGNCIDLFNGIFDDSRGVKNIPTLTIERIASKQNNIVMPGILDRSQSLTQTGLSIFLLSAEIILTKVNDEPWRDDSSERILSSHLSPAYFGLQDTVHVQNHDGTINLSSDKKSGGDIVSVALNGRVIVDQVTLNKKDHADDIYLDTGLNIITFFADNFGNGLPNRGKLNFEFGNQKYALNFANKADSAATFIVAKLYWDHNKEKDKDFQNYIPSVSDEKPLQKNDKLLSSIVTTDQEITFAVWDDAVEDGDSVSINIDGKWLVQGFPVKIKPQFIHVTLKPGPNTITFKADNLGSIPPNTSVLEIIDGNKRKSFTIETTPEENNLIKIFYDVQ
jgi:hypothetical protein